MKTREEISKMDRADLELWADQLQKHHAEVQRWLAEHHCERAEVQGEVDMRMKKFLESESEVRRTLEPLGYRVYRQRAVPR